MRRGGERSQDPAPQPVRVAPQRRGTAPSAGAGAAGPSRRPASLLRLQRLAGNSAVSTFLQRHPGELDERGLLLSVVVGGTSISWNIGLDELGTSPVAALRADPKQIAAIEHQVVKALAGAAGRLSESQVYLQSPPVRADVKADVQEWSARRALSRLPARLEARAAAVRSTRLRYPLETQLATSAGISPAQIDWPREIAAMRAKPPAWNTMIEASRADRFELALKVLEAEAAVGRQPDPSAVLHTDVISPVIFSRYAATDPAPSELQTDAMVKTNSEAFLAHWLPRIRDVRLVPDSFDLQPFAPTGDLDPVRKALVATYVDQAAPRTMEKFLLDLWTADSARRMPEEFVRTADIGKVKAQTIDVLTKDFLRWAPTQPGFRGAFWAEAGQRAAFAAVTGMFQSARALQSFNATLADRFQHVGTGELSEEEWGIAKDPFGYAERLGTTAAVTQGLVSRMTPGKSLEQNLLAWNQAVASAWSAGRGDDLPALLLALVQALGGLQSTVEQQEKNVKQQLTRDMDVSYAKIAQVIRNEAAYADEFITTKWVPMLKTVALEQVTANRDEMKQHLAKWPEYRAQAGAKFRICAHVLDDLMTRLKSGDLDSIEMDGQLLTKAHLPQLEHARDFMQGQAEVMADDSKAADKKDEIQEAVDGFEKVRKRILNGDYKPAEYSKAVYEEARNRLGLSGYQPYTSMLAALDRWAVVPENPFLAYAIARWQWEERVKELDKSFKVFLALGLLTVASLVVPGAAGVVLGVVDVAVGVAHGIGQVQDAYALLDLAMLDDKGTVKGVTVEQARAALKTAWIGLGLNVLLGGAGLAALFGRLIMVGRGASKIPGDLAHLSALAKVNPVAAEKMIAQVKDLAKVDDLLRITGDSVLLERMLAKTGDVRHLEFVLMHGDPRKVMELVDLAGDSTKLGRVLEHAPDAATAERLLKLTDDADGLAILLRNADNAGIAEELLRWTSASLANRMVSLAGDQTGLLRLKQTKISPEVAVEGLAKAENADELAALVRKMDSGPDQVAKLLKDRTVKDVEAMLAKGVRPKDAEMGVGAPRIGPQPGFAANPVPVTPEVRKILEEYGIAHHPMLQNMEQFELGRIKATLGNNKLPTKARGPLQEKAARWAVDGAKSPGDLANQWEYFKTQYDETWEGLTAAESLNKSKDAAAAQKMLGRWDDFTAGLLTKQAQVRDLGGIGWVRLDKSDAASVQSVAQRLTFGSETAATYHPLKHADELPLAEAAAPGTGLTEQYAAYLASARRTIVEGKVFGTPRVEGGAMTIMFRRSVTEPGGIVKELQTVVKVKDDWALIASHGKPGKTR